MTYLKQITICKYIIAALFIIILDLLIINATLFMPYKIVDICIGVLWILLIAYMGYNDYKRHTISFHLLNSDATLPTKRDEDAGYDIYPAFNEGWMIIQPHETTLVPTGLSSAFSSNYVAILKERGSTGSRGIGQRAGVIDSGYRGEWFVAVTNHNSYPVVILKEDHRDNFTIHHNIEDFDVYQYSKAICQAIFLPVPQLDVKAINTLEFEKYMNTERGVGVLGSSNK